MKSHTLHVRLAGSLCRSGKSRRLARLTAAVAAACGLALTLAPREAAADFSGAFAPGNFTFTNNNANGSVNTSGAPSSISITGGNNEGGRPGDTSFTIAAPATGQVQFNWSYTTQDRDGPNYDPFGYVRNGTFVQVTNNGGARSQSGLATFGIGSGQTMGFRVHTTDNILGAASSTISNFLFSSTVYWKGNTDVTWTGANWTMDVAGTMATAAPSAGSNVIFSATGAANQGSTTLNQDISINSLMVTDITTPVVISNGTGGTHTLAIGAAGTDITVATGANLTINSKVTLGGSTIEVDGTGAASITGVLGGSNGLTKTGTGTLTLSNSGNNYTGGTTISGGKIVLGVANALPTGTALSVAGTLDLAGLDQQVASVTGAGMVTDSGAAATFTVNNAGADSFAGAMTGANLAFLKTGAGTLTLTGASTFSGGTEVSAGTLVLGDGHTMGASLGSNSVTIDGGATLTLNLAKGETFSNSVTDNGHVVADDMPTGNYTISSPISGTGDFTKTGGNTVTLTGNNTYMGGTTINGGTLLVNNTMGSGTGSNTVAVKAGATLGGSGNIAGGITLNGTIAPGAGSPGVAGTTLHAGSLAWDGGGALTLQLGATGDQLVIGGAVTKLTTNVGPYTINIRNAGITRNVYTLATYASIDAGLTAGTFTLALPAGYSGALLRAPTSLSLVLAFSASGATIENVGGPNTPLIADFTVTGAGMTGTSAASNTINSLTMPNGSSLLIFDTLTVTGGRVSQPGGSATITGGTLFGPKGLHFDVNGNLFLGSTLLGNAVKTGTGSLFLDGALFGDMTVLQGLLGGNGSIFGNLSNLGGIVSPGHSPGRIGVSGNFTQGPGGLLRIEIGGTDITQHDLLAVGGTATLGGTLQLVQLNGFNLKRNESVNFLTANGGVMGRFSLVENGFTSDTILQPTVVYGSNSVALEALQGSFAALAGLTPNQKSVGRALDSAANDHRTNSLFDYLDYRTLNKLPGDLEKISPEELTSVFTLGVSLANVQSQNIQRRNDDIRCGSSGFSSERFAMNGGGPSYSGDLGIMTGVAGPNGNAGKESKAVLIPAVDNRWGVFLSGTGEWASVGDTDNARGYELESGGFTLGVDYKVTPNLAIGLAAGYTGTTADLTQGGRIYVNGGKIGLYGTFFQNEQPAPTMSKDSSKDSSKEAPVSAPSIAKGFYADVAVFGGYNSYDTRRSALQGTARGDTDGGELNVLFGTGYDFKVDRFAFGPTATFNYTYIGTNEFTEHGSLAPLDVHGGKGESLRTAFGFKASYDWKVGGILIKPELRAAWQHEYGDSAYALDANFANGAGNSFLVNGPELGRDSVLLGAGFALQLNDRCSLYTYYDGELGRKNYQATNVTGGFRVAF